MARFFIDRPVFAWVLAIFIILAGVLAIPRLAVERYPAVAPPSVSIYASYPGASPQTLNDAVVGLIERELSSVKHLLYFESSVDTSGEASITATFKPGTNPELAQVDVQNRIKAIEPRLPRSVRQNGLFVEAADSGFLMLVGLRSPDASVSEAALGDFMARNIIEELRRIDGVGRVQLFGAEQAMRVWLDPTRLTGYGLTMGDVAAAIGIEGDRGARAASRIAEHQQAVRLHHLVHGLVQQAGIHATTVVAGIDLGHARRRRVDHLAAVAGRVDLHRVDDRQVAGQIALDATRLHDRAG